MSFSPGVRREALVASARHCCVCHRYKGVKVEVHHIVPEGEGGSNDFDNAITLCFDCHTDAGHYNPQHPRGSKFSKDELRMARDRWYAIVREQSIRPPEEPDRLYCRYLVCKEMEVLREIAARDLSRLPIDNAVLVENQVLGFLRTVLDAHSAGFRLAREWGEGFESKAAYLEMHPDAIDTDKSNGRFAYFDTVRVPPSDELLERVAPTDGVARLMLEKAIPPEEIARALGYEEVCGGIPFQEVYNLRPLWGVFLAVTNISDTPIILTSIYGTCGGSNTGDFRQFADSRGEMEANVEMPGAPLGPSMSAITPLGTILGPIHHISEEFFSKTRTELRLARIQEVGHARFDERDLEDFRLWGPVIRPVLVGFKKNNLPQYQPVHELDLSNLYVIDRFWEMGSCPHLFLRAADSGELKYKGELLARSAGIEGEEVLIVPPGVSEVVIAELEEEVTYLTHLEIDGCAFIENQVLHQGTVFKFSVMEGTHIRVRGKYIPKSSNLVLQPNPWRRNGLICGFLDRCSQTRRGTWP